MKKLLSVLALALALCGCGNNTNNDKDNNADANKPTALATLDVATYSTELGKTTPTSVKIRYNVDEKTKLEGRLTAEDSAVVTSIVNELNKWTLTKATSQEQMYVSPTLYIDLNANYDANYARIAVYEADVITVEVRTNEGFAYYELSSDTPLTGLQNVIKDYFTEA